jgi:hypothetical protein
MTISDPPQGSGSGNPPYAMASLYGNDNVNDNDTNVPTVAAYAVSEADLRKTTDTSFLPTTTPTIGTYSNGPVHQDVETAPNYNNNDSSSPPVTGSALYPLPPPQSNPNTTERWCLICGSLTLTIGLTVFVCCILPIIIICAAISSVLQGGI